MRTAFSETLLELALRDPRIWLVCGDLGYSVLDKFMAACPDRFLNAGVAEQNMMGVAAGLALSGKTVFVYSIVNFPTLRCLEQIRNDVCYHEANVKIVTVGGGFAYAGQGYTHHGVEDLAILRSLPGMTVVAPGDAAETRLAALAIAATSGPCYLRLGRGGEAKVHAAPPDFQIGKAITVREGTDLAFLSIGGMLKTAVDTADQLAKEGIGVRVLSMHTLKPLDEEAVLVAARETGGIVTIEEHSVTGGLGDAVADVLARRAPERTPFHKVGAADRVCHDVGCQRYMQRFADPLADIARGIAQGKRR